METLYSCISFFNSLTSFGLNIIPFGKTIPQTSTAIPQRLSHRSIAKCIVL
jgi:hypothetical protein